MSAAASIVLLALAGQAVAYPWVPGVAGVDSSLLRAPLVEREIESRQSNTCPFNPVHSGAVPYNSKYPYCGARGDTIPATFPCLNNRVPAVGDTAHQYIAPTDKDIRGPCPGINTAANHGFLSRDGITTYAELVEMQQNVYGVGYDLANALAIAGVGLDGDVITQKLSIGCDATSRTGSLPGAQSGETGLNGHNKFEGDSSLTRNDYFTANGDNFRFNRTLFDDMINNYCKGNCNLQTLADYRFARFNTSKATNPNFFFGPLALLLYGAASFLYELMPSAGNGVGDTATMKSFFIQEKIPDNWFSRTDAYDLSKVGAQILAMYGIHPVPFGANLGTTNSYGPIPTAGTKFDASTLGTPQGIQCAIYLLATQLIPSTLVQSPLPLGAAQSWAITKALPFASISGCPLDPHEIGNPTKM